MTIQKRRQRIKEIQMRVAEYHQHRNDPYAYYHEEVPAVGDLHKNALGDIEFLLGEVDLRKKSLRT